MSFEKNIHGVEGNKVSVELSAGMDELYPLVGRISSANVVKFTSRHSSGVVEFSSGQFVLLTDDVAFSNTVDVVVKFPSDGVLVVTFQSGIFGSSEVIAVSKLTMEEELFKVGTVEEIVTEGCVDDVAFEFSDIPAPVVTSATTVECATEFAVTGDCSPSACMVSNGEMVELA